MPQTNQANENGEKKNIEHRPRTNHVYELVNRRSFALPEFGWDALAMIAIALSCAGAIGDLAASAIKRRYNAKDFGTMLGPQGGLLDRLDSLIPTGWLMLWVAAMST